MGRARPTVVRAVSGAVGRFAGDAVDLDVGAAVGAAVGTAIGDSVGGPFGAVAVLPLLLIDIVFLLLESGGDPGEVSGEVSVTWSRPGVRVTGPAPRVSVCASASGKVMLTGGVRQGSDPRVSL